MKAHLFAGFAIALILTASALPAMAQEKAIVDTDAVAITAQQLEIRRDADARRGRFNTMNEAQLRDLKERQARVLRMLDGKTRTTELPPADQVRLLNDLEAISALLNKANDERLVCERQRITGSKLPKTVCMTVAEKRSAAGSAGNNLKQRNQLCADGWGSGFCKN